jgi:tRNA(fMet)-specific endonuclease VapC
VEIDEAIAWETSRIARELKGKGLHIGDNDVWIAATALAHGLPLVSNNAQHLGRVKGLRLLGY